MSLLDDLIGEISSIRASIQGDIGEFLSAREKLQDLTRSRKAEIAQEALGLLSGLDALEFDVSWMVQTLSEISGFPEWQTAIDIASVYGRMKIFIGNVENLEDRGKGTVPSIGITSAALIGLGVLGVILLVGMRK